MSTELFPLTTYTCLPGDLWSLGQHLLLCADSTDPHQVDRLLAQVHTPIDAVISDPPYGELTAFWDIPTLAFIPYLQRITKETATCMLFCSLPYGFALHQAMIQAQWQFRFDAVWEKKNAGFQVSKYQPLVAHEHLFAYAKDVLASHLTFHGYDAGEKMQSWGDRCSTTGETNQAYAKGVGSNRIGREDGLRWIRSILPGRKKQEMKNWERTKHPTQKDVYLVEKLVRLLTNPSEVVYDPFVGSGTTLLACERTGRRCVAIEQSPAFCGDDVLRRWHQLTNREPVLLNRVK